MTRQVFADRSNVGYLTFLVILSGTSVIVAYALQVTMGLQPSKMSPYGSGTSFFVNLTAIIAGSPAVVIGAFGFSDRKRRKTLLRKIVPAVVVFGCSWALITLGTDLSRLSRTHSMEPLGLSALVGLVSGLALLCAAKAPEVFGRGTSLDLPQTVPGAATLDYQQDAGAKPVSTTGCPLNPRVATDRAVKPVAPRPPLKLRDQIIVGVLLACSLPFVFWSFSPLWLRDVAAFGPAAALAAFAIAANQKRGTGGFINSVLLLLIVFGVGRVVLHLDEYRTLTSAGGVLVSAPAGLVSGVLVLRTKWVRAFSHPSVIFGLVSVVTAAYLFGVYSLANQQFDPSRPEALNVKILNKHSIFYRRSGGRFYLRLAPWGPIKEPQDEAVSASTYESLSIGQKACVIYGTGLLGTPWFDVQTCVAKQH